MSCPIVSLSRHIFAWLLSNFFFLFPFSLNLYPFYVLLFFRAVYIAHALSESLNRCRTTATKKKDILRQKNHYTMHNNEPVSQPFSVRMNWLQKYAFTCITTDSGLRKKKAKPGRFKLRELFFLCCKKWPSKHNGRLQSRQE